MRKNLAIIGHPTRGKEVIELLEMMGGMNFNSLSGFDGYAYYIIEGCQNEIRAGEYIFGDEDVHFFNLEEFLEKYPFKVGDEVVDRHDRHGDSLTIKSMSWSADCETMVYDFEDSVLVLPAEDIVKLTDDNTTPTDETITPAPDITADVTDKNNCGIQCPDGYEFYDENGNLIGTKVMMRPKKPKYPNDYKTCCDALYANSNHNECYEACLRGYPMDTFARLLICRDAYWEIAGKEMGLGKPWESPLPSLFETVYCIRRKNNEIIKGSYRGGKSEILEFPTEEIRDAFFENFKDLIEKCGSLL